MVTVASRGDPKSAPPLIDVNATMNDSENSGMESSITVILRGAKLTPSGTVSVP